MSKLDELKALLEKATAGPWEQTYGHGDSGNNNNVIFGRERPNQYIARIVSGRGNGGEEERHANAQLIALLRNMAPDLLRVVEALDACKPKFWGTPGDNGYDEVELSADEWMRLVEARARLDT